jgi:putative ABC transport system permease protein
MPGPERDGSGKSYVSAELISLINVQRSDGKTFSNVQVRGMSPMGFACRPEVKIVDGRVFTAATNEAIVSRNLSKRYASMNVGDTLKTGSFRWVIVGLLGASGSAYESEIWTDVSDLSNRPSGTSFRRCSCVFRIRRGSSLHRDDQGRSAPEARGEEAEILRRADDHQRPGRALAFIVGFFTAIGATFGAMNTMYAGRRGRGRSERCGRSGSRAVRSWPPS